MKTNHKMIAAAAVGALTTLVLVLSLDGFADGLQKNNQVSPRMVYNGTLEKNGETIHATFEMTFTLYDGETGPAVWVEAQTVPVYGGRFSVVLGSTGGSSADALAEAVQAADDLHLGVTILDGDATITLGNRQRFVPVPYARWTLGGTDLVANAIDGIQNGGKLNLNTLTGAPTEVGGELDLYGPDLNLLEPPYDGTVKRGLVHGTSDRLIVNYNVDFEGGTRLEGPVETEQPLLIVTKHVFGILNQVDTGHSIDDWHCAIAGVRFLVGDIEEGGAENLMHYYTYREHDTDTWWISMDFNSEGDHEEHEAAVFCFRTDITSLAGTNWWSKH